MLKYFTIVALILRVSICWADTHYMAPGGTNDGDCTGSPCLTLQYTMGQMSASDTLEIADGTYTGASNVLDDTHYPPNGTAQNYTIIRAENNGSVTFDGEYTRQMFYLNTGGASYIQFEGIKWAKCNPSSDNVGVGHSTPPHHIKFLRCGVWDAGAWDAGEDWRGDGWAINNAQYILLEECYAYGNFRYGFYIGNSARYIVVRRCVARIDSMNSETGIAAFMAYDAQDVAYQNCIAIDADSGDSYYKAAGMGDKYISFYLREQGAEGGDMTGLSYNGCIALHQPHGSGFLLSSSVVAADIADTVIWDTERGSWNGNGGMVFDHCTLGEVAGTTGNEYHTLYQETGDDAVTNCIFYGNDNEEAARGDGSYTAGDYNCFYANLAGNYLDWTAGSNDITGTDPTAGSLEYLVRIEDSSALDGAGSTGDIGATILKKWGADGTFWGESGYNSVTAEDLWPFPYEAVIRTDMRAYSGDSGNITGAEGFCATGQTLTKYIWEYLGNTIPEDIYGATPGLGRGISAVGVSIH